jgi:hypothetical protein
MGIEGPNDAKGIGCGKDNWLIVKISFDEESIKHRILMTKWMS